MMKKVFALMLILVFIATNFAFAKPADKGNRGDEKQRIEKKVREEKNLLRTL